MYKMLLDELDENSPVCYEDTIYKLFDLLALANRADSDSRENWQQADDASQRIGFYGSIHEAIVKIAGEQIVDHWSKCGDVRITLANRLKLRLFVSEGYSYNEAQDTVHIVDSLYLVGYGSLYNEEGRIISAANRDEVVKCLLRLRGEEMIYQTCKSVILPDNSSLLFDTE